MKTEEYLNILTEQIRCKKARGAVCEEIRGHIEDQTEFFLEEGMDMEAAEAAAVEEMGDPVETGAALNRIHRPKMAWGMIGLIGILSIAGLIIQYSIQLKVNGRIDEAYSIRRQLFFLLTGFCLMIGICFWDYTRIGARAKEIMIALVGFLFFGSKIFGIEVNGAQTWIYLSGISFHIKIAVMLLVPLYGAILYHYRGQGYRAILKGFLWMIPGIFLMLSCPDFIMAMVLFVSFVTILVLAISKNWFQVSKKKTLSLIGAGLLILPLAGSWFVLHFGAVYQRMRLQNIFHPGTILSAETEIIRDMLAGSRFLGESWSQSADMAPYMPDYVLSYTVSYYGILAAAIVIGLIAFVLLRFLQISFKQKNSLGMIMGAGCSIVLLLQMVLFLANNVGMLNMAVYCPFLTYGGSGIFVMYTLFGLLLSIYRYQNVLPELKIKRKQRTIPKLEKN